MEDPKESAPSEEAVLDLVKKKADRRRILSLESMRKAGPRILKATQEKVTARREAKRVARDSVTPGATPKKDVFTPRMVLLLLGVIVFVGFDICLFRILRTARETARPVSANAPVPAVGGAPHLYPWIRKNPIRLP